MDRDGTHATTADNPQSAIPLPKNPQSPPSPAKLQHNGFGLRVDQLYQFAQAVADGKLTPEQLAPQMPPELLRGVCALAGEIAAARIPLVAIGPDWELVPREANYIHPGSKVITPETLGATGQTRSEWWLARVGYVLLGLGAGMALGVWLYRAGYCGAISTGGF